MAGPLCPGVMSKGVHGLPAAEPRISGSFIQISPEFREDEFEFGRILDRDAVGETALAVLELHDRHRMNQIDMSLRGESGIAPEQMLFVERVAFGQYRLVILLVGPLDGDLDRLIHALAI